MIDHTDEPIHAGRAETVLIHIDARQDRCFRDVAPNVVAMAEVARTL